jgi:O-antigen ligase
MRTAVKKDGLASQGETTVHTVIASRSAKAFGLPFWLVTFYLVLEYGRPHESLPVLGHLHLPALIIILLGFALVANSGRVVLADIQIKLFVGFIGLMAIHVPFAVNNRMAFNMTVDMMNVFVVFLAIVTFVDSPEKLQTLIKTWIATSIYLTMVGNSHKGQGVGSFFGDENDLALFLNMMIPFAFFLALQATTISRRLRFLIIVGTLLVGTVTTFSRGGFIGLAVVGFYCLVRSPKKFLSSLVVVVLILVMFQFAPEGYWDDMGTIADETDNPYSTGNDRLYSWKAGWRMFLDHPILGVGPANFPWNFADYEPKGGFGGHGGMEGRLHGGRVAHSLYFTLIPELGSIGTILFAGMILSSLKDLRFIRKRLRGHRMQRHGNTDTFEFFWYLTFGLGGSLAAYLASGTFISVLYYPHFWIWMGIVVALRRQVVSSIPGPESMHNQQELPH